MVLQNLGVAEKAVILYCSILLHFPLSVFNLLYSLMCNISLKLNKR